jgi:hypothetical protein
MLASSIDLELFQHGTTKAILGQHPTYGVDQNPVRMLLQLLAQDYAL